MRLAAKLGKRDVDKMLRRMTARQFQEWQAFYILEPWGEERSDARSAQICAVVANTASTRKRNAKRFKISDFMLMKEPKSVAEKWKTISSFFMNMQARNKDE